MRREHAVRERQHVEFIGHEASPQDHMRNKTQLYGFHLRR